MAVKGLKDLERKVEDFKDVGERVAGVAAIRLERSVMPAMQRKIISHDAVASTELFRSFRVSEAPGDFGDRHVRLQNYAPHGPYVEFGTGGFHRPNPYTDKFAAPPMSPHLVAEIRKWIIMKPSFVLREGSSIEGTAQAIATAIAFGSTEAGRPPGTPAQPFFFNTWFEQEVKFRRAMRGTFKRRVTKTFGPG